MTEDQVNGQQANAVEAKPKLDSDIVIIQVTRGLRDELQARRITEHETYREIIRRLLDASKTN